MNFGPTITLGDLVSALVFLGGLFAVYGRMVRMETKLNILFSWWKNQVGAVAAEAESETADCK